jgi:uncharacterized protein YgiM (DUF1202 family)
MTKTLRCAIVLFAFVLCLSAISVSAQQDADAVIDPNAQITFPPPVYLLRGEFEVRGTANLEGMVGYFLEYRLLNDDLTPNEDDVWLPATIPSTEPVVDDVLGVWDTTLNDDGLYELRLTILFEGEDRIQNIVTPLRVENEIPPFLTLGAPVPTEEAIVITTSVAPAATTAPVTGGAPTGVANVNGNVRTGDSTSYPVITGLRVGQQVDIVGVSNTGSGWYQIRLPDGRLGFVAPTILTVTGDTSTLPRVAPPPVPASLPTNTPAATAVPSGLPDALITNVRFDRTIKQGEAFQFIVTVRNESDVTLPGVSVACNFTPQNQFFSGNVGDIAPRSQIDAAVTARLDSGGGANTTANCAVDVNNLVAESNETNNFFNLTSALAAP